MNFCLISPFKFENSDAEKMTSREQRNYFDKLKRYVRKFDNDETEDYKMLLKRHKDDEDLDKLSIQRLIKLFEKYHLNRDKKNYDHFFNKPPEDSENKS